MVNLNNRQTDNKIVKLTEWLTFNYRQTNKQANKQTNKQTNKLTSRQTHKHTTNKHKNS
jgi:hypothetical protein